MGKLTYVKSTEAFDPTHAIIPAQNSTLEAPDQDRVDSYVEAILGGMERARGEGLPEGSYEVAQALPAQVWQPLDLADRLGRIPNSMPSTRPPATRTASPANDNGRPAQPLPNRIARESAMQPLPSQQAGPAPGAPGGAAGQAISQVWQYADELMSGHALGISPNIYREASAAEAALRQWAADYSAAHGGSPVPEYIWGAEQDSLNAVRLPGMQSIRDAIRDPSEARAILRDYADMHGISPRDLSEEEIRDILASEDPMAVPRPGPIAQSEATPEQVRVTRDEDKRKEKCERTVSVDSARAPQSTRHMLDAWAKGYPSVLTLCKACAAANRVASLRGVPIMDKMDRDEYPPAMFLEGGIGASVRHLPYSDNRSAGAQIGNQLRSVPEGCRIAITIR